VHVLCVIGTRPEAIKMAPVIRELTADPGTFRVRVCVTAQHRELLDGVLRHFGLEADDDLDLMRPNQSLPDLTAALFSGLGRLFERHKPDWVVVQGDTSSAMVGAVAGVMAGARVAHVEAGLRTGRMDDPFPEELNRVLIGRTAHLHFASTDRARSNLLAEGVDAAAIVVTGNPGIDALMWTLSRAGRATPPSRSAQRSVLVTLHRREAFGAPLARMCGAIADLAAAAGPDVRFICPVHPNPNVAGPMRALLGHLPTVRLIEPVDYPAAAALLADCYFVMTDSGGLQEEAPALGKPVLVLRDATERPEGIAAGVAELVGRDHDRIVAAAMRLLTDEAAYARMARVAHPYGDGHAAERIAASLRAHAAVSV
jgi:UDP-N-acetylglucosamine 2-epimerase (non-hydrolysing)